MGFTLGVFERGDGTYTGATVWAENRDNSVKINADPHDTHDEQFATGLSTCLLKDGTQTVTADIPFAGFELKNIKSATARSSAAQVGDIQDSDYVYAQTLAGTSTAITMTLSPTLTAYVNGMSVFFRMGVACGNDPTLNVDTIGAKDLMRGDFPTLQLQANALKAGSVVQAVYNSTATKFVVVGGQSPSYETAAAAGTNQAGATAVTCDVVYVTSRDASNTGIRLPNVTATEVGRKITVINNAGGAIVVYPDATDTVIPATRPDHDDDLSFTYMVAADTIWAYIGTGP